MTRRQVARGGTPAATGVLLAGVLLAACAAPLQSERLRPGALPGTIELERVGFFPQEAYQCGPAALATTLEWAGVETTPAALAPAVYLPERRGSLQLELIAAARRHGTVPYVLAPRLEALLAEIAAGHPVIVFQNLALSWYPKWHYAVAVGFDLPRRAIVLRSGRERRHVLPLALFERTWRRGDYWAVVVMPPARVPATADELGYLRAVAALEDIGKWQAAAAAYEAALGRWPLSLGARLGLGNSRYALGELDAAAAAYRAATSAHPGSGIAFNNLAQVLAEQGRLGPAQAAAERAVALGGPHLDAFRATLSGIRNKKRSETTDAHR